VQRGHNRQPCFADEHDLSRLPVRRYGGEAHTYVLMTNHVHLLVPPRQKHGITRRCSCSADDRERSRVDLDRRSIAEIRTSTNEHVALGSGLRWGQRSPCNLGGIEVYARGSQD